MYVSMYVYAVYKGMHYCMRVLINPTYLIFVGIDFIFCCRPPTCVETTHTTETTDPPARASLTCPFS
jgi:hypothetical protein